MAAVWPAGPELRDVSNCKNCPRSSHITSLPNNYSRISIIQYNTIVIRHDLLTSFECIFRESILGTPVKFEESPAPGDTRWLCDAAAATGKENKDKARDEDALLKAAANSLAAYVESRV